MKPLLAFTMGDPAGIGPEITAAAARHPSVRAVCSPLLIGSRDALRRSGWRPGATSLLDPGTECAVLPGRPTARGGRASFCAVRLAVNLARRGWISGIVTAPISKEAWRWAGVPYPDHTEYLRDATGVRSVAMMLVGGGLRAVLATRHLPLRRAVNEIGADDVVEAGRLAYEALRMDLGFPRPRLALCALNPHAGEGGLLGDEERERLRPAIRRLKRCGAPVSGPLPADSAWALHCDGGLDGLIALYHDQALIPLKTVAPFGIVNWTLGLPFVRTSPGHGTAFDIAGRRRANPSAMIAAALLAARLAKRRGS